LHVHTSNYRVVGFTESVEIKELCTLAQQRGLPCIDDIGSGLIDRSHLPQLADEPSAIDSIRSGADLVLFSGDKLLGGPQCGIILGRHTWINKLARDPLVRALRVDKMVLAALEATLRVIRSQTLDSPLLWQLLRASSHSLNERAVAIVAACKRSTDWHADIAKSLAEVGGGSCPGTELESWAVRLRAPFPTGFAGATVVAAKLRCCNPPVVARIQNEMVWIDLRTVLPEQDNLVIDALRTLAAPGSDR
jgi:L-seryl-tRNA(Ser) seleniumtransferase